jgi:hypothetical protein
MNSTNSLPGIFVSVPLLNELELIPRLLDDLNNQNVLPEGVVFCINQPDEWWGNPEKKHICLDNQNIIKLLKKESRFKVQIIDRSSPGSGWRGKQSGVGWARKTAMDIIAAKAADNDIIVSLDADTTISPEYLQSVAKNLSNHPCATGLSVPYYHRLTGIDETLDRAMLRYEIYMRCYAINLWRIGSPYSFSALGSAIAIPVWAYKAIGGITPQKSGEDFYLLQKLRKFGPLLIWNEEKVFPATRFSDRVFFGTGPALIKGAKGDWSSYPIYKTSHFEEVRSTYLLFKRLFEQDFQTPMTVFLEMTFGEGFWQPLRKNARTVENFAKACHQKVDALRILQYLKWRNQQEPAIAEESLAEIITSLVTENDIQAPIPDLKCFSFESSPLTDTNQIRDFLVECEEGYQRNHTNNFNQIEKSKFEV